MRHSVLGFLFTCIVVGPAVGADPVPQPPPWTECFAVDSVVKGNLPTTPGQGPQEAGKPPAQGAGQPARPAAGETTVRIGDMVDVRLKRLQKENAAKVDLCAGVQIRPNDIALFVDGMQMAGLMNPSMLPDIAGDLVARFYLDRSVGQGGNSEQWRRLLAPTEGARRALIVSVGRPGERPLPSQNPPPIGIDVASPWTWAFLTAVAFGLMVAFGAWLSKVDYNMLRDNDLADALPPDSDNENKPIARYDFAGAGVPARNRSFSLARCQMLLWTCIVLVCFVYLYLVLNDYNSILTTQTLILMGVAAGTTLAATTIDKSKKDDTVKRRSALVPEWRKLKGQYATLHADPARQSEAARVRSQIEDLETRLFGLSQGLVRDLLTDIDGYTLHRLQAVAWTLVMGFVFLQEVPRSLGMPAFGDTLLWLIGISNGAYLGFKASERQVN